MKRVLDSFVTNAAAVMLMVLCMIIDEQGICQHPIAEDMAYGAFIAVLWSFIAETVKASFLEWRFSWFDFGTGTVVGYAAAFGFGYLIFDL